MIEFNLSERAAYQGSRVIEREAVRAVIFRGNRLLMIHSEAKGDYKFPGGGRETGESREEALRREIKEECGASMVTMGRLIGRVREERPLFDEAFDCLHMVSYYYLCAVEEGDFADQQLDPYEKELEFAPVWITPEVALEENRAVLNGPDAPPPWTKREARFLRELLSED